MKKSAVSPHIDGPIHGVFSTEQTAKIGFGSTKRTETQRIFMLVEEDGKGALTTRLLNANAIPADEKETVSHETFLKNFMPEPDMYANTVQPALTRLNKTIARAERHRTNGENFSAEYEFTNALEIHEDNVRATFGLGLTLLDRGDTQRAELVFAKLISLKGTFSPEHKHLFNEFGISLRKNTMHTEALTYYSKAEELSPLDDHLLFNIGRVYVELGEYAEAKVKLEKALEHNPDLQEAKKLLKHVQAKFTV